ncbi:wax ester/triacylglycerol synthase family O-acyltransferase [Conexibacter sp. CPCC 206217]|uniref:WS/DGAT/MGAT family O-acyltransferase n=1 Tax=Conexibacter sp. CPCC 206217 TaxID=3064574 RepID=UPI00271647AD|nr:wax ester/triacylglycerol synthase family O-acyltransferase [Conexibacter sp. CPCC 206217]MDO8210458.1 wax ester/triacylglycerol synthase family O-acyltransferase [Conexibacter sp. CPCC 206217]
MAFVANRDRLSGLDSSFLHLEHDSATHMHVASCMVFEGPPPTHDELVAHVEARLHLVPRYRQRLAFVPLSQGRPVWVDDPHFNTRYHVQHHALPEPGGDEELKQLAGRAFSQQLDRNKPLWELWLVEGLADGRFALLGKTHHALVDGISGVDITTVLFDLTKEPPPTPRPEVPWVPRPLPSNAQLLADALLERTTVPGEIVRGVRASLRAPRRVVRRAVEDLAAVGSFTLPGVRGAPPSPLNVRIGPHRRFTWDNEELERVKAIKNALGGTVNDVVLATVSGGLGRYLRAHGHPTIDLVLRAMIPVSVRADAEHGALGNQVAAIWAGLPVGVTDPIERLELIKREMDGLKESGQAVGARVLTELTGFAPPTVMAQAARLQAHQRFFNLVVTNVPGPQLPLYVLGRRMLAIYPMVPLAQNQALGIAIMSYDGRISFGLNADFDALPDLELLAGQLSEALEELAEAAGLPPIDSPRRRRNGGPAGPGSAERAAAGRAAQ